jgi:hypothetical protein
VAYTAGARFNAFFLIYIALMTLSAYAMIAGATRGSQPLMPCTV